MEENYSLKMRKTCFSVRDVKMRNVNHIFGEKIMFEQEQTGEEKGEGNKGQRKVREKEERGKEQRRKTEEEKGGWR